MTTQQRGSSWNSMGYLCAVSLLAGVFPASSAFAQKLETIDVEGQPLAANAERLAQALDLLGTPLAPDAGTALRSAAKDRNAKQIQDTLDPHVLLVVSLNPESRVKVARGPAAANLQQGGYTPVLIKIINASTVTKPLQISSPQAGPVY